MTSKQNGETEREKERERRRLRDRQRRKNMSKEQRERHLARRRKNYRLRRLRAQNAANSSHDTNTNTHENNLNNAGDHVLIPDHHDLPTLDQVPISSKEQEEGIENLRKYPRRLRLNDIKHLARSLHCDDQQQNSRVVANCKRLRLIHIKRLARAINITVSDSEHVQAVQL